MKNATNNFSFHSSLYLITVILIAGAICFLLSACSSTRDPNIFGNGDPEAVASGSVVIAKRMPPVTQLENVPLYGFLPFQPTSRSVRRADRSAPNESAPSWVEVNLKRGTLSVNRGKKSLIETRIDEKVISEVRQRKTKVIAVSEEPAWLAPDEYFTERGLTVPPEGDSARFLKGALGRVAVFLDNGLIIHSGPVFSGAAAATSRPEGIRVNEGSLESARPMLKLGTKVVIR